MIDTVRKRARQPRCLERTVTKPLRTVRAVAVPSPHRFADVGIQPDERGVIRHGPFPVRFSLVRREPRTTAWDAEALGWPMDPPLDLVEIRRARGAVTTTAVRVVDLAVEPLRSAAGMERELAPLIDRLGGMLRLRPGRHTLHLELSGEPTKDQLEGLARVRDYALKRVRETAVELDVHVASPAGRPTLRPPKP